MHAGPIFAKEGSTLLLIPSLGRGAEDFAGIAGLLSARGHRIVSPEPFGLAAGEDLGAADLETLARHMLAALGPDDGPVVVVGHAFGNWVARMAAVLRPDCVAGVVLLAAARRVIPPAIRPSIDGSFDLARADSERLMHLRNAYFAPGNDASVWLGGWHPALAAGQRAAAARSDRSLWWDAGGIVPILDVQASADRIAPAEQMNQLRDELGARVASLVIENAGHALLPEQPEAVAEAIDAFAHRVTLEKHMR